MRVRLHHRHARNPIHGPNARLRKQKHPRRRVSAILQDRWRSAGERTRALECANDRLKQRVCAVKLPGQQPHDERRRQPPQLPHEQRQRGHSVVVRMMRPAKA